MRTRYLAVGAAAWVAGYAATYLVIIRGQGNSPVWWYLALLAAGGAPLALAAAGRWSRSALIAGTLLLGLAALAAVLSIGVYLVPGVVAAAVVAAKAPPRPNVSRVPA